jgi:hypothetical protein
MSQNMPLLGRVLGTVALASVIMSLLRSYQWSGAAASDCQRSYDFTRNDLPPPLTAEAHTTVAAGAGILPTRRARHAVWCNPG